MPDATGLIHYRARYYDPALGRFTQPDPAGFVDGINRYAYVGNSPVNFTDPLGLGRQAVAATSGLGSTYGGNEPSSNILTIDITRGRQQLSAYEFFSDLSEQSALASSLSLVAPIPGGRPAALVFGGVAALSGAAAYILKPDPVDFYQDSLVDITLELTNLPPLIEIPLGIGAKELLDTSDTTNKENQ